MFAFFNNSDEVSVKLPVKAADMSGYEAKVAPLEQALAARRKEIAPAEQEWEVAERAKLLKTAKAPQQRTPLKLVSYEAVNGTSLTKPKGDVILATGPSPATDTYIVTATTSEKDLTGFRLEVYADEALPAKGPGRAPNGNFVLTAFRAFIVDESGKQTPITLQRAEAKFSQPGFDAANAIGSTAAQPLTRKEKAKLAKQGKAVVEKAAEEPGGKKKGWATLGKTGETNMLTVRTTAPLTLAAGQSLRFELEQDYGNKHTIGRFALFGITGDSRGLHLPANIVADLDMYPEKRVANTKAELFDYFASQDDQIKSLQQQIAAAQKEFKVETMAVRTIGASLRKRVSHVFERGDFLSPAAEVSPNTLATLPPLKASGKVATRLDLARWLVSPDNMLTPRVAVNQVWTQLFGAGLVTTANDFGVRGERPSHPELLDWLAATYRDDLKWSLKGLIRTIVNSATYRQSSRHRTELVEVDPLNTLLARQNRIRVQGEVVRDLALSVSGLLSPKIGGPSVFPPMPEDLAKLSYANNFSWKTSAGEDKYRRGMYTFFKRTIPHPMLMTFDCPEANTTCVVRNISNTPLQALTLLNNDAFVEASQALARRVLSEGSTDDRDRLSRALKLALVREPGAEEISRLSDLLTASREYYKAHPDAAKQLAGKPLPPGDTSGGETAAWTATLRVILNLDEFITRE
jgi:hypothetical protein